MDGRKNNGGNKNAGRKPKVEEEKANNIFLRALKEIYNTDKEDDAKVKFVKDTLLSSQRGQLFVAEHIFGKPKETIDQNVTMNNFDIRDIFKVDKDK